MSRHDVTGLLAFLVLLAVVVAIVLAGKWVRRRRDQLRRLNGKR